MTEPSTLQPRSFRFGLRSLFAGVAIFAVLVALPTWYYRYMFPYGRDHCCDKAIGLALISYADANGGRFPSGGDTPEASLSLLYPAYLDASELRGKTFPEDAAAQLLKSGKPLTPDTCGWQYVDGLTMPKWGSSGIAIFWDKIGLGHNGERSPHGGHSVTFMDAHGQVISEADWPRFIAEQQKAWNVIRQGGQPTEVPWNPEDRMSN